MRLLFIYLLSLTNAGYGCSPDITQARAEAGAMWNEARCLSSYLAKQFPHEGAPREYSEMRAVWIGVQDWPRIKSCCFNARVWSNSSILSGRCARNASKALNIDADRLELCLEIRRGQRSVVTNFEGVFYKYLKKLSDDLKAFANIVELSLR